MATPNVVVGGVAPNVAQYAPPEQAAPVDVSKSLDDKFADAVDQRDEKALFQLAKDNIGTDDGVAATHAANVIAQNNNQVKEVLGPILQAGGIQTPQGRLVAIDTWKTVKDNPRWKDAFIGMLLGQKDVYKMITGGNVSTRITYDDLGRQLEEHVNELGERVRVTDVESGQELNPNEYAARRGGQSNLANTKARLREMETEKINREAFNTNEKILGSYSAAAPTLYDKNLQRIDLIANMPDLTRKQRDLLNSYSNRIIGTTESMSKALGNLKQYITTKDENVRRSLAKGIEADAKVFGFGLGGKGEVVDGKGNSVGTNDLDQLNNQITNGKSFDQKFTQTLDDMKRNAVYQNMTDEQRRNFDVAMKLTAEIEKTNMDLLKEGRPGFLITAAPLDIADQNAVMVIQSLSGMFNSKAVDMFQQWKKEQLPAYERANKTPSPFELEAAFARSPQFLELKKQYADRAQEIISRPIKEAPERDNVVQQALPVGVAIPAPNIPVEKPAAGKAPPKAAPASKPKRALADILR